MGFLVWDVDWLERDEILRNISTLTCKFSSNVYTLLQPWGLTMAEDTWADMWADVDSEHEGSAQ